MKPIYTFLGILVFLLLMFLLTGAFVALTKEEPPRFKTSLVESEFQVWAAKAAYAESKDGNVNDVWLEATFAFRDSSACRDFIYFAEDYALAARFAVKQME